MASATPFRDNAPTLEATEAELSRSVITSSTDTNDYSLHRLLAEEISVQTE